MKKFYTIEDFYPAEGDQRFSLIETSPLDSVSYTVFTADDFTDAAIYDYGERKCLFPETDTPLASFYGRFARWKAQRGKDIAAAFSALRTVYQPLDNYSMEEKKTGTETELKTPDEWKSTTEHSVSQDYKETETQKPDDWISSTEHSVSQDFKETESQKPTNWKNTKDFKVSQDYKETDTDKPTDWMEEKQTNGNAGDNNTTTTNSVVPFNASDYVAINKSSTDNTFREKTERTGTYTKEHTQEGTRTEETSQSGTFDTEKTQTGTKTDATEQSGTYAIEKTQTGTKTDSTEQSGTYAVEKTQTGKKIDATEQSGTFEDKMTYNTTLTRSGNIGTVTSQMMAEQELDLRMKQFVRDVIKEFFDLVSVYA